MEQTAGDGRPGMLPYPQVSASVTFNLRISSDDPIYRVLSDLKAQLNTIQAHIQLLQRGETTMAADLSTLQNQVTKNTSVIDGAVQLINGLAAQIAAAKNDPVAIQAIVDQMNAKDDELAQAVTANTPAQATT
jgi:chromosome segregation ATPase